ncbi:MAG TPA: hypothetical protein VMZ05_09585 [Spirochaetota bacterium]|nr:hypothetical protein [Spirochaetota bacterium]
MGKEKRKILEMLSKGKISVDEAEKLLNALSSGHNDLGNGAAGRETHGSSVPRYLRVVVEPGENSEKKERVNIRVPMKLIRSGIKWASLIPKEAREKVNEAFKEKGIDMDFTKMKEEDLEELVDNLRDLTVDVEGEDKVRVFCE